MLYVKFMISKNHELNAVAKPPDAAVMPVQIVPRKASSDSNVQGPQRAHERDEVTPERTKLFHFCNQRRWVSMNDMNVFDEQIPCQRTSKWLSRVISQPNMGQGLTPTFSCTIEGKFNDVLDIYDCKFGFLQTNKDNVRLRYNFQMGLIVHQEILQSYNKICLQVPKI